MVFTGSVSDSDRRAAAGSVGGSAADAGVEYQRSVAAYTVAFGLAGVPVAGFGPAGDLAIVRSVSLETNDAVDDIRIQFVTGAVSYLQAKRVLSAGKQLDAALNQWALAGLRELDVGREHLVIVAGSLRGVARHLSDALMVFKAEYPGKPANQKQSEALRLLNRHLSGLSEEQREAVRRCASILELRLGDDGNDAARSVLAHIVAPANTNKAWHGLVGAAGKAARIRGGRTMGGWLEELRSAGVNVTTEGGTFAAQLAQRAAAVQRHADGLRARRDTVDLRVLGAEVPPIPLDDIDAGIKVVYEDEDNRGARNGRKLLWAFLRHGRVVLTGLPGSGKSRAVVALAADLMERDPDTLVVLARLADVDSQERSLGFVDRLAAAALRHAAVGDRGHLTDEILERLGNGRIVVLLDGLDETYERRGAVVAQLTAFLRTINDDVDVLISTRDVGYGQAATLGWQALRIKPPEDVGRAVHAVLDTYAQQQFPATDSNDAARTKWRTTKEGWVQRALGADATLTETPLLPVLLATLAAERNEEGLPTKRAEILGSVIDDVVRRHEDRRDRPLTVGNLYGSDATHAVLAGFETEASFLLDHDTTCQRCDVVNAVSVMLARDYGLAKGLASAAGETVVRVWDESGIFVASGGAEIVSPRLVFFAEIGDARAANRLPSEAVPAWVADRTARGHVESVVLAAGLSTTVANSFAKHAAATANHHLLHAFWKAVGQGAQPGEDAARRAYRVLLADSTHGDREAWKSWTALAHAVPDVADTGDLLAALRSFPPEHQSIGRALIALNTTARPDLVHDPVELLTALRVRRLARLPNRVQQRDSDLRSSFATIDETFSEVITKSADVVVGRVAGAEALVVTQLEHASAHMHKRITSILDGRGYGDIAAEAQRQVFAPLGPSFAAMDLDQDGPDRLLLMLAEPEAGTLTRRQSRRLDELGDLLETLNINSGGSFHFRNRHQADQRAVVSTVLGLGGFREAVIAGEAKILQSRMNSADWRNEPMWALLHGAGACELDGWEALPNPNAAVTLLVRMLSWSTDDAHVAASALWAAPVADRAAPAIRKLMSTLDSSPGHLRIAAHVLASFDSTPEPCGWADQDDPILREVATHWCEPVDERGRASVTLVRLLEDRDGHVREAAVDVLAQSEASDRCELLEQLAHSPEPSWTCTRCRTLNPPGQTSCSGRHNQRRCGIVGPRPSRRAAELSGRR